MLSRKDSSSANSGKSSEVELPQYRVDQDPGSVFSPEDGHLHSQEPMLAVSQMKEEMQQDISKNNKKRPSLMVNVRPLENLDISQGSMKSLAVSRQQSHHQQQQEKDRVFKEAQTIINKFDRLRV